MQDLEPIMFINKPKDVTTTDRKNIAPVDQERLKSKRRRDQKIDENVT